MASDSLVSRLAQVGGSHNNRHFSLELRREASSYAWRQREAGVSQRAIAEHLGINRQSLARWMRDLGPGRSPERPGDAVEPVVVVEAFDGATSERQRPASPRPSRSRATNRPRDCRPALVMRLPGGASIEGLDACAIAAILQSL
ncbi:MAG: hypothetical protein RIT45_658 [Pseudomonadota bacterium]